MRWSTGRRYSTPCFVWNPISNLFTYTRPWSSSWIINEARVDIRPLSIVALKCCTCQRSSPDPSALAGSGFEGKGRKCEKHIMGYFLSSLTMLFDYAFSTMGHWGLTLSQNVVSVLLFPEETKYLSDISELLSINSIMMDT